MKNLNRISVIVAFLLTVFAGREAVAFPLTSSKPWNPASSFEIFATSGFTYDGIVALSNCSGSFVKFKSATSSSMGLVLTNGHCTGGGFFGGGMPKPGQVIYKKPQVFNMKLLNHDGSTLAGLKATTILYATMTNTDVALLELNQTYAQIEASTGIKPLVMSDVAPVAGAAMDIPSGYWKRTYSCFVEATVPGLKEGGYDFVDSIRYSPTGCDIVGGTSGSPIVSPVSGEVIAINNTANEDGQKCTMNNPCEVDAAGNISIIEGRGYGQQTYTLSTCVNAQGVFDLSTAGCVLPK